MASFQRVIEVVVKGKDGSGPLWTNLRARVKDLTRNKLVLAAAATAVGTAIVRMVMRSIQAYNQAIGKAGDFQKSILEVNTLLNLSGKEIIELSHALQDLSVEFGQAAGVMAKAEYDVVSAGFTDIADSMHLLRVASKAAIAGNTDVATSVKVITQTLNAYGRGAEDAEEIAGDLFATIKGGVVTFEELSGTLGKVTATASVANIPFKQISAAMAVMTKNGSNAAESATALNAFIIALGAASGESKELLDELGITLKDGLGPALVSVADASDGALDKIAELIPNVRAIRAAASLAKEGGKDFADQLEAMTTGVQDFNTAYQIMSVGFEQATARNEAANARLEVAIGSTGLEGKAASIDGVTDSTNKLSKVLEENADGWKDIARESGEASAFWTRLNGTIEAGVALFGLAILDQFAYRDGINQSTEALKDMDKAAKDTAASVMALDTGALGPLEGIGGTEEAAREFGERQAKATLQGAADAFGVATSESLFDAVAGGFINVPRATEDIVADLNTAYQAAVDIIEAGPPVIERSVAFSGAKESLEDELLLLEEIIALEEERARQANETWEQAQERAEKQREDLENANDEYDEHIEKLEKTNEEMEILREEVEGASVAMAGLAAHTITAMLSGEKGAIMFGRALKQIVLTALEEVIRKLLVIQALKLTGSIFNPLGVLGGLANGGTLKMAGGGTIPRGANGFTVPSSGARPGMDSVPAMLMPDETVLDRDLSIGLRRFLASAGEAATVAPSGDGGGRGGVSVVMQVARPVGLLDVLDLGESATAAAKIAAEADF